MTLKKTRLSRVQSLAGLGGRLAAGALASVGTRITAGRDAATARLHRRTAENLLETFSKMKGLPMKVGQIFSFMDGVVPAEYQEIYRTTLARLQVRAEPHSWEQIQKTFLSEFGKNPEEVFAEFDRTPVAAASIGQVYRARIHSGQAVAVKIQYPGIQAALSSDLKNVETILNTMRRVLPSLDVQQLSGDFLARFYEELDYVQEAKNQADFYKCWERDPKVVIPAVQSEFCRPRVLVTSYHSGRSFAEVTQQCSDDEKSEFGETLFRFTFQSILEHGLFNADPHPGNYLFQDSGRVVFLDFGSVQRYDHDGRVAFRELLTAVVSGKTGEELWAELEKALLIAPGTPEFIQKLFLDYFLFVLKPVLAEQPFRYTPEFTARVSELSIRIKKELALHLLKTTWHEPKRPGLAPLVRILFGMNSILATLGAEADWRDLILSRT